MEQPLAKHSACNLCSINLSEYVLDPFTPHAQFDTEALVHDIYFIVKAMDDVIDENLPNHALPEQRDQVAKYRNIGIGIMGIHDAFIKHGIKYGSKESIERLQSVMHVLFRHAVFASATLGQERGNFSGYDSKVWESSILRQVFDGFEIEQLKKDNVLRNCSLLSVAPCGSIGTMLNVSTGIEPWFSTHYTRNTKSLNGGQDQSYEVWAPVVKKAMDLNWHVDTIVTAGELNPQERLAVQATVQNYCDTAISSTLNLPKGTTPADIREIYIQAWKKGLKGVTVYVDGSRDPILATETTEKPTEPLNLPTTFNTITPVSRKTLGTTIGATHCKKCACGTLYITTNMDKDGNLVEVFTHTSKGGICQANLNSNTRLISLALRSGVKIDEIEDQLKGIHCPACQLARAKGHQVDGMSCPDIIAKTIKEFIDSDYTLCQQFHEEEKPMLASGPKCPECGEPLQATSGCWSCQSCGYSKCS